MGNVVRPRAGIYHPQGSAADALVELRTKLDSYAMERDDATAEAIVDTADAMEKANEIAEAPKVVRRRTIGNSFDAQY